MKWYVSFKWLDFFENEMFETKEFTSESKARKFYDKIKKETRALVRKYGRKGIYHPLYEITIYKGE